MKRILCTLAGLLLVASVASAALTFADVPAAAERVGRTAMSYGTITFDNDYDVGGETLAPGSLKLSAIDVISTTVDDGRYSVQWDESAGTLIVYTVSDTIAVDIAAFTFTDTTAAFSFVDTADAFTVADTLSGNPETVTLYLPGAAGSAMTTTNYVPAQTTTNYVNPTSTAGTAVLMREVDDAADLSGLVVRVIAWDFPGGN